MKVKALQGDTVDLLCQRYYGTTQGVTEICACCEQVTG